MSEQSVEKDEVTSIRHKIQHKDETGVCVAVQVQSPDGTWKSFGDLSRCWPEEKLQEVAAQ
jgi:hypothetical protein